MSWEYSAFGPAGIMAYTASDKALIVAGAGSSGVMFSSVYADPDVAAQFGQAGTGFNPQDLAFDQVDALYACDSSSKRIWRNSNIKDTPNTWTEQGYLASAAAQNARCIAPRTSSDIVVISGGDGIWRKSGATWSQRMAPGTGFASTTCLYRRCLMRFMTVPQVLLAYDPVAGKLWKSVDFGVTWFLFWTHASTDVNVSMVCAGPTAANAYLVDGTTIWRINNANGTSATATVDNAQITVTDCNKAAIAACSDGRGDICVIVPQVGGTRKVFRSQSHPVSGESWQDEEDGNLGPLSSGLTFVALSDDGYIYAGDPNTGVLRGTFETKRLTVETALSASLVQGGAEPTLTVTIEPAAPSGGQKVWIDSTDRRLADPGTSVLIPEGETEAEVDIETQGLSGGGQTTITAITRPDSTAPGRTPNAAGTSFAALGLDGGIPIQELGLADYQDLEGGLYDEGSNVPPDTNTYRARGQAAAAAIVPRNAAGGSDAINGKILFASLGFSNPLHEWDEWTGSNPSSNPKVVTVNGAQSGMDLAAWTSPAPNPPAAFGSPPATGNAVWDTFINRVRQQGTDEQLQAVWMVQAVQGPQSLVPSGLVADLETYMAPKLEIIRTYLKNTFPNLKILFVSNRTWGGYHDLSYDGGNPEPWAYQTGFVMRTFVLGSRDDAAKLWTTWGPEWWANGVVSRADGLSWPHPDYYWDGTHESLLGLLVTARYLEDFFENSEFSEWWVG